MTDGPAPLDPAPPEPGSGGRLSRGFRIAGWRSSSVLEVLAAICEIVLLLALTVDLVLTFSGALLRYFAATSVPWFNDAIDISLNVIAFLGAAAAYRRLNFMAFTFLIDRCKPRTAYVLHSANTWLVVGAAIAIFREWPAFFRAAATQQFTSLAISQKWAAVWLGIGMVLVILFAFEKLARFGLRASVLSIPFVLVPVAVVELWSHTHPNSLSESQTLVPVLIIVAFALLLGTSIPFVLALGGLSYFWITGSPAIASVPVTMQSGISNFILLAIPFFVVAGVLMEITGMSARLLDFVEACIGRLPGGLLLSEIVGVYLFSGLSGSKTADMAAVGGALRGPLKARGYPPEEAVGVLAASGVMGVTVPPSINLIIVGSITTLSISSLFVAGIVPAAVLALVLAAAVMVRAIRKSFPRGKRATLRGVGSTLIPAIPAFVVPLVIVGGIVGGIATPTEASSLAVVYGIIVALVRWKHIPTRAAILQIRNAAVTSGLILFLISTANLFGQAIVRMDVPHLLIELFTSVGGKTAFLLVCAGGLILIGCLLEGLPALYIFAPILVPLAGTAGIDPLQFAIVIIMAIEMGAFLPPLGTGVYVACAIMDVPPARAFRPLFVYWSFLAVGLVVVIFFPQLTVALPHAFGFR